MNKLLILFFLIFTSKTFAEEFLINITGIAKVGKECFLNLAFQNQSSLFIENVNLLIYSFDKNNLLVGKSNVYLNKIKKNNLIKLLHQLK